MRKTILLGALWAYAGWTAGSAAVLFFTLPGAVGPLAGLAALFLFVALVGPRPTTRRLTDLADAVRPQTSDLALDGRLSR